MILVLRANAQMTTFKCKITKNHDSCLLNLYTPVTQCCFQDFIKGGPMALPNEKKTTSSWPPDHCPPLTPPLSHSLILLSALYTHSSHNERWHLFLTQLQRLVKLWAADQSWKVTQITHGHSTEKEKKKKTSRTSCWKKRPILIFCEWTGTLAFHLCSQ